MKTGIVLIFLLLSGIGKLAAQNYIAFDWTSETKTTIQLIKSKGAYVYTFGTFNNTVVLDGNSYTPNGSSDVLIEKYDTLGNRVWVCQAGGALKNDCYQAHIDDSDYVYLTGTESNPLNPTDEQIWTAKISGTGQLLWSHTAGSNGMDRGLDITADYAGNVYVSGYVGDTITFAGFMSSRKNGVVLAYTAAGSESWIRASTAGNIVNIEYVAWDSTLYYSSDYYPGQYSSTQLLFGDSSVYLTGNFRFFSGRLKLNGYILTFSPWSSPGTSVSTPYIGEISIRSYGLKISQYGYFGAFGFYQSWNYSNGITNTNLGTIEVHAPNCWYPDMYFFSISYSDLKVCFIAKGNNEATVGNINLPVTATNNLVECKLTGYSVVQRVFSSNAYTKVSNSAYGIFVTHGSKLSKICESNCPMSMESVAKDTLVCPYTVLDSTSYGKIVFNGGSPPYTYQWSPSTGVSNPNKLHPVFTVDTSRTYVLSITDSLNNVIYDTVTFLTKPVPPVQILATGSTHLCMGSNDTLILKSSHPWLQNSWYRVYPWQPPAQNTNVSMDADSILAYPLPASVTNYYNLSYVLLVPDSVSGCQVKKVFPLNVYPVTSLSIAFKKGNFWYYYNRTDSICENIDTLRLKINVNGQTPYISNSVIYKWYKNGTYLQTIGINDYIDIWEAGEYVLEASDGICTLYDTLSVYPKLNQANVNIWASSNPSCSNTPVQLVSTGANSYLWMPGGYVNDSILIKHSTTTTYTVVGKGCISDDTATIQVNRLGEDFFTTIVSNCGTYVPGPGNSCLLIAKDSMRQYGSMSYTQQICTPTSGPSNSNSSAAISNVQFAALNLTSWPESPPSNIYEPHLNGDNIQYLERNHTYELKVKAINPWNESCRAWVDFDRDGVFSSQESFALNKIADTFRATITIPAGAQLGASVLRVRAVWNSTLNAQDACKAFPNSWNETEDYPIHIFNTIPLPLVSTGTNSFIGNTHSWSPSSAVGDSVYVNPVVTTTYQVISTDANGCQSVDTQLMFIPQMQLYLKAFIEGYMNGTAQMTSALSNSGLSTLHTISDSMTVELVNVNKTAVASTKAALKRNGDLEANFPVNFSGSGSNYYVVLKHRNAVAVWTPTPLDLTQISQYNFSSDDTQAYGNNLLEISPGVYALFSGDINQDGVVDGLDFNDWESDSDSFSAGYISTDLNGDGIADGLDFLLWESNSNHFVGVLTP